MSTNKVFVVVVCLKKVEGVRRSEPERRGDWKRDSQGEGMREKKGK